VEVIETERLVLRRPRVEDAPAIFTRYASDPEVTRYMAWPTHRSLDDTHAFLHVCDALWTQWPKAGPLLVFARDGVTLLGAAGVAHNSETVAQIGYVLARDAWGRGYATEALTANVEAVRHTGLRRLEAGVHVAHRPSCRVLEKAGFARERIRPGHPTDFPNLPPTANRDSAIYVLAL
jgi:RimJ/RimL family protein N-acetyltransferase